MLLGGQGPVHQTAQCPEIFEPADLDGDGLDDLFWRESDCGWPSAFRPDAKLYVAMGAGGLRQPQEFGFGFDRGVERAVARDFDGDGRLDLLVMGWVEAEPQTMPTESWLRMLQGRADGTFEVGAEFLFEAAHYAGVGDVDGDGLLDLLVQQEGPDGEARLTTMLGDGAGGFVPAKTTVLPRERHWIFEAKELWQVGHFDDDGRLDLAAYDGAQTRLWRGLGDGTFVAEADAMGRGWPGLAVDWDGDSRDDLVLVERGEGEVDALQLWLGRGDGSFSLSTTIEAGGPVLQVMAPQGADGGVELHAALGLGHDDLRVARLARSGALPAERLEAIVPSAAGMSRLHLGRFRGGGLELALWSAGAAGWIAITPSAEDGAFPSYPATSAGLPGQFWGQWGDFEGDGSRGLVLGSERALAWRPQGSDALETIANWDRSIARPVARAVADLDADGRDEVVVALEEGGNHQLVVYREDRPAQRTALPGLARVDDLAVADVDGDGLSDVILVGDVTSLWLQNASGQFERGVGLAIAGSFVEAGDFDGDGVRDLAIVGHRSTTLLLGLGNGLFSAPIELAHGGEWIGATTVGDLDGDGRDELIVALEDRLHIVYRTGEGAFASLDLDRALASPGALAVGDVNGDGMGDILVGSKRESVAVVFGGPDWAFSSTVHYPTGASVRGIDVGSHGADGALAIALVGADARTVVLPIGCAEQ